MATFLKLVGASTYNSRATGAIRRHTVISVTDDAVAEHLLEKGEHAEDGHFRPMFVEVAEPGKVAAARQAQQARQAVDSEDFGGAAPQDPEGLGEGGAETGEGEEGEGEEGGEEGEGEGGEGGEGEAGEGAEGEGAAPKAAKVVRQRKPAATK